jgi:hypothetical protein
MICSNEFPIGSTILRTKSPLGSPYIQIGPSEIRLDSPPNE